MENEKREVNDNCLSFIALELEWSYRSEAMTAESINNFKENKTCVI